MGKIRQFINRFVFGEDECEPGFIHIKTPDYELKATFGDKASMLRIDGFIYRECSSRGYFNDTEEEF